MIYLTEGNTPLNEAYNDEIVQERNNTYQLTFRFPTSDPKWELLKEETFLTADDLHGEQDFYIFEVEKQQGYIQVYANQVISLLNNYIVSSIDVDRVSGTRALSALAGSITRANPFSFFSDIDDRHTLNIKDKNAMEVLAKDKHSILGQWGGDMVRNGYNLRLLKNGGSENESLFMYKKNLSSYQHKTSTKSLKTRITFKTTVKGEGEKAPDVDYVVVIDSPLLGKYSQIYEAVVEVNDQNVKDQASLIEYGKQYFRTSMCDMLEDSLEISVVGQSDVAVRMFDVVSIYHEWYGLDVRKKITKYTYSPMAKRLKSIGFGTFQSSLANAIGGIVNDAVLNESRNLHKIFDERLKKEIANADRAFDAEFAKREKNITDAIEQYKAKAEEVKQDISNEIDKRFQNFDNASIQEARRKAEEALRSAGASSLLAQEAKQIGLDSVARLEAFKSQTTSAQTALSGDLTALKRTIANDIRPKQAQAEAEIAKQVEALNKTKNELSGIKSAQATYEETTTRRLAELANVADGKASKSELTQTAEELASKIASVKVGGRNLYALSKNYGIASSSHLTDLELDAFSGEISFRTTGTDPYVGIAASPPKQANDRDGILIPVLEEKQIYVTISNPLFIRNFISFFDKDKKSIKAYKRYKKSSFIISSEDLEGVAFISLCFGCGGTSFKIGDMIKTKIKIEYGTIPTDWSPAPEDQEERISIVESNFKQRADALDAGVSRLTEGLRTKADISALNVTAENIRQSVKSLETNTQNKLDQKLSQAEFEVRAGSIRQEILNATKDKADKTLVIAEAGKLREEFSNLSFSENLFINSEFKNLHDNGTSFVVNDSTYKNLIAPYWHNPYNSGLPNHQNIQHGHFDTDTFKETVFVFDESDGSRHHKSLSTGFEIGKISVGEYYFSTDLYATSQGTKIKFGFYYHKSTGRPGFYSGEKIIQVNEVGNWIRMGTRLTVNDDIDLSKEVLFYIYGYNFTSNSILYLKKPKISKGLIKTDWSPAPEDTDGLITEAKATFERTAQGLRTDLSAIQEYVNKDGQRQEALQSYAREESAKQATAVRELVTKDYVGKATYQETVRAIENKFEAITNPQNGSIATQIANYKKSVDGRFADITSLISGKANQTDFQRVKETSQLYERILGNTENGIADKVARMAMTNQLFQVEVGKAFAEHQNLFLNSTLTKGFLGNNGIIYVANATQKEVTSDFISVDPNEKIIFQHWVTLPENGMAWTAWQFFDKNKNPIDNRKPGLNAYKTAVGKQHNINQITIPANAYFVRFSARMYDDGLIKVEKGSTPSDYSVAPNDALEAVKTVQRQLTGSWAVQNINSAGDIISGINLGANGHNRITGKLTHITGDTLIDKAVIKSAMIDKLKTANFESGSVTTEILDAEAVTADKVRFDNAFIRKMITNEAFIEQLTSKQIFATKVESVITSSTVLEGYKGWIGGFQLGTHDSGYGRWITGRNHFSVGMGNGEGGDGRTALWVNWGNNWSEPGYYAWFVKNNGKMYCYNTAEFWKTPIIHGDLKVTGRIFYDGGVWIYSGEYEKIGRSSKDYFYLEKASGARDWFPAWNDTSDRRLKSNIQESSVSGVDVINRLKTYSYRKEFNNEVEDISCGIMAQDVQKYAPDAFREGPDGVYTYNTFALVPYLIKAIQELNQKIEKMEKTIA
nr:MAG TPA: Neck appendage protein [Caudoviricetes sp.]